MLIRIAGSSDAYPVPRPYCRCRLCTAAARFRGPDVRTRTHVHLFPDGASGREPEYAVDLPPDLSHHMIRDRFFLRRIEHLLITHAHFDHLDPSYLLMRGNDGNVSGGMPRLTVYGSRAVHDHLSAAGVDPDGHHLRMNVVEPEEVFQAGSLQVKAIPATHRPEPALNFVVSDAGASVLLAWDTGPWSERAWSAARGIRLQAAVIECTAFAAGGPRWDEHLSFEQLVEMRDRMLAEGMVGTETPFVAVHMGHHGGLLHRERAELGAPYNITPGRDGMTLKVQDRTPQGE